MGKKAIARKKIKVGNRWYMPGEEIKQWRFFKPRNKEALINTGKVKVVEEDDMELQRKSEG